MADERLRSKSELKRLFTNLRRKVITDNMMSILIDLLWRNRVQSDWDQADEYQEDFIKNKPTLHDPVTIDPDSAGVASIDENQVLTVTTPQNDTEYGVQSGGERIWIVDYDYTVLPAIYYIGGTLYSSPETDVTLAAADATNDRIDLFVLNTDSEVVVITGTPAENPSVPSLDPATQLALGFVLVTANTTQPVDVTDELVYDENVEWTASAYGVLVDFASTTLPKYGSVCADVGTIGNDDYLMFTAAAPVNFADYENIISYIKFKQSLSTKESISVRFLLDGVGVSNQVTIPFEKSNISWQAGVLPITMFTLYAETFDAVRFTWKTKGLLPLFKDGFYFDYVKLQLGVGLTIYNDTINLVGDVTGTGRLGLPVPTTLATVNANVGSFGTAAKTVSVTVDGKGRVTGISENDIAGGNDVVAGDGMDFVTNADVTLGTPSTIDSNTTNAVTETSHTHALGNIALEDVVSGTPVGYGGLYNWYAATDTRKITSSDDWVVPTQAQAAQLTTIIGGSTNGGKLKETGNTFWDAPNTGATNELGFNARGSGYREAGSGVFNKLKQWFTFITSTEQNATYAYGADLNYDSQAYTDWRSILKKTGYSLRLLYTGAGTPTTYTGNDGKVYPVVLIGTQRWISCNLNETKYRNGDWITGFDGGVYTPISNANWAALETEAMCCFDDNEAYGGGETPLENVISDLQDQIDAKVDEKVKYDAADPTAGYLSEKVVAGVGITIEEGTGADENKMKVALNDTAIKVAIDFIDAGELVFVYNCPVALVFTSQESEGADATLSPVLNTNMSQYGKVTVTAAEVGLIVLNGNTL